MRNVFDQYDQPENKLTHALVTALSSDPKLVVPFLRWLKVKSIPTAGRIQIEQQTVPGSLERESDERAGLPDACFFDDDGWAVLIESKVQSGISSSQLERHAKTAARYGYEDAQVILFAVDDPKRIPKGIRFVAWKDVYGWFSKRRTVSTWARRFAEYVEIFESKMIAKEYDIRGTLTMFNGFHFSEESPYTYHQGKRLLKLVRQELQRDRRLRSQLKIDPSAPGRGGIKQGEDGTVWDFIPLRAAKGKPFTHFAHLTLVLTPDSARTLIIVPNSVKGGFRTTLKSGGVVGFSNMLIFIEKRMRRVLRQVPGARPFARMVQRHYKTQSSPSVLDGHLEFDLRTLIKSGRGGVKQQPMWVDAMYQILVHKKTNIQMSIEVDLPYSAKVMQSKEALNVMAECWLALKPLLDFVMGEK